MRNDSSVRFVTLKDLWDILTHRIFIIILAAVVVAGGLLLFHQLTYVPIYSSTATLYILRQESDKVKDVSSDSDFSLALKVVNDCDYLLKSHSVLDEVIQKLKLEDGYDQLSKSVHISNPDNTRILEVKVESDSPEHAKQIVDVLCEIGQEKITEAMGFQQVNFYERGTLDLNPSNRTKPITYVLAGIIASVAVYTLFLIAFLLDDYIRTDEDIERYLGLSILGDVPDANEKKSHQYGYHKYYGKAHNGAYGYRTEKNPESKKESV